MWKYNIKKCIASDMETIQYDLVDQTNNSFGLFSTENDAENAIKILEMFRKR